MAAISCTVDTVCKDHVQKKKQFNGYSACSYCYHPGTLIDGKFVRYTILNDVQKRTHENALQDMEEAFISGEIINGFKGISPLAALPFFDVINGFAIDYMHTCLIGVVRQLTDLWLESKNHRQGYYIGRGISRIDAKLLKIKPPNNISRIPKSLKERALWHANEFRNWLLFYSIPCLYNILPKRYLLHFALLSKSIYTLLQSEISQAELELTKKDLDIFVKDFEVLYGQINMVYNVHLLSHLVESVRHNGPLWTSSNFHFEDNNKNLRNFVKGTKDVLKQVVSKYLFKALITNDEIINKSQIVAQFYNKSMQNSVSKNCEKSFMLLGKAKYRKSDDQEKCVLKNHTQNGGYYNRFFFKGNFYHSSDYCDKNKTDNSVFQMVDGSIISIKSIYSVSNDVFILGYTFTILEEEISQLCTHLKVVELNKKHLSIFKIDDISEKCVHLCFGNKGIVTIFPNKWERD